MVESSGRRLAFKIKVLETRPLFLMDPAHDHYYRHSGSTSRSAWLVGLGAWRSWQRFRALPRVRIMTRRCEGSELSFGVRFSFVLLPAVMVTTRVLLMFPGLKDFLGSSSVPAVVLASHVCRYSFFGHGLINPPQIQK